MPAVRIARFRQFQRNQIYWEVDFCAIAKECSKIRHIDILLSRIEMAEDSGQTGAEIEVTPSMEAGGRECLARSGAVETPLELDDLLVAEIYRAMAISTFRINSH